jgi:hypothetical protein
MAPPLVRPLIYSFLRYPYSAVIAFTRQCDRARHLALLLSAGSFGRPSDGYKPHRAGPDRTGDGGRQCGDEGRPDRSASPTPSCGSSPGWTAGSQPGATACSRTRRYFRTDGPREGRPHNVTTQSRVTPRNVPTRRRAGGRNPAPPAGRLTLTKSPTHPDNSAPPPGRLAGSWCGRVVGGGQRRATTAAPRCSSSTGPIAARPTGPW